MCGIVGAIAERQVSQILLEGLKRLEYRGYDSAGIAVLDQDTFNIQRKRVLGKVAALEACLKDSPLSGHIGIAHTRWATHGKPNEINAHPHCSSNEIAIVHNGIIENHDDLRQELIDAGYHFESDTDTEVIVHLLHHKLKNHNEMLDAIADTANALKGAYGLSILSRNHDDALYAVRSGSPLVIGVGIGENFFASDPLALLPVTQKFIYLEEGDIAKITRHDIEIRSADNTPVSRAIHESQAKADAADKGNYRHFMLKEIHEQPEALNSTLETHISKDHILPASFGHLAQQIFTKTKRVKIIACGTSYHAGLVASYWIESIARLHAQVEIASEYRYRDSVMEPGTLVVAISQSGETADTLAAVRHAKSLGAEAVLAICNAPESSLSREADLLFLTRSGKEIGVAATKTFTAQLSALSLLTLVLGHHHGLSKNAIAKYTHALASLPQIVNALLSLDQPIAELSKHFIHKTDALFIARGELYPIAMEGALKLKEISYMHAEAYAAGELKHGPLALIDENMPVIVVAPDNALFDKVASNIQEILARGGDVYVITNKEAAALPKGVKHIAMPDVPSFAEPIAYTIPLQLLSYHIAVLKGTDVDQPRNLAKSVTVE